ncbi:hypothetical protein BDV37DRAFT_174120 [Aspergillus pseudonomiae]|uniref:Uncharacterized protein n=1 Tax=Aspergillus pseudonomiae TaxID=1506151 RepID=A0A5N7DQ58_9EURO|nr:uncharacterized protein BDV37DRAFT_174120 [Aspergillus pseudonomiae]KAE8408554.1 hypothetical protein BDV37DRAFT_174120 [Aspergillus pseudonomiae]
MYFSWVSRPFPTGPKPSMIRLICLDRTFFSYGAVVIENHFVIIILNVSCSWAIFDTAYLRVYRKCSDLELIMAYFQYYFRLIYRN